MSIQIDHKDPTPEQLDNLAEKAEILEKTTRTRPVVLEFAGSPKAGKSTSIEILTHFLRKMGFRVWAPLEGASKRSPSHLKNSLVEFNCWTLNYAISELLVGYHNRLPNDIVILDRGPFDSLAWITVLLKNKELDEDEYAIIQKFATNTRWASLIDRVYLFTCKPELSLERESNTKLTNRAGTAINPRMLEELLSAYNTISGNIPSSKIITFAASDDQKPKTIAYKIASDVLDIMKSKGSENTI